MTAKRSYAPLNTSEIVPIANLASGTPDGTKFVRDDNTLAVPAGSGLSGGTPALTLSTTNSGGVAGTAVRTDATIAAFDGTTPAAVGTAATGAAGVAARRDHVHATGAGTPSTQALGDSAATGSGPAASMTDHKHAMPAAAVTTSGLTQATGKLLGRSTASTGAIEEITVGTNLTLSGGTLNASGGGGAAQGTPALTFSTTNASGSSGAYVGTDGTIALFDATTPAAIGTAAVGAAGTATRRDHVHATGAGTPSTQTYGDAAATGSGPAASMTDHKHAMPASILLAETHYAPGTDTTILNAGTQTAMTDIDATNLAITFTAPASGKVMVDVSGMTQTSNGTDAMYWGIRESTTTLDTAWAVRDTAIRRTVVHFYISGISAGSHTYKWAYKMGAGTTSGTVYGGPNYGRAVMRVWAA